MTAKILVRYGEIALKGKNRGQFEQQLHRNLKEAVRDAGGTVTRLHGRFIIEGEEEERDRMLQNLSRVFGVVSLSHVYETELDRQAIEALALNMVREAMPHGHKSFRVETRRANKDFPYTSPEFSGLLGFHIQQHYPELTVDLKNPSLTISVEIGYKNAFLYMDRLPGPGGLPVGVTGRALLLLSGGIDSPVAGWLSMKRGLTIEALHFHSFPFTGKHAQEKTVDLCRKLTAYTHKIALHMINVAAIQKELRAQCPDELGIILLRRMMLRLASTLCAERDLQAVITGDNLGQVASQTLESLDTISRAVDMLILRPLLGMDKSEIIALATAIDTYETSIRPYEDCCTVFLPKKPVTRPKIEIVEKYEEGLDMNSLPAKAMESLETRIVTSRAVKKL